MRGEGISRGDRGEGMDEGIWAREYGRCEGILARESRRGISAW